MSDDLKLLWHPDFGAVLCIEADSDLDISDVLSECPFTSGLTSQDVRCVRRRRFWRLRRFLRRLRMIFVCAAY